MDTKSHQHEIDGTAESTLTSFNVDGGHKDGEIGEVEGSGE